MQASYASNANDFAAAENTYLKALREAEKFGPQDFRVSTTLSSLGSVYRAQKKYADADSAFRRALAGFEHIEGGESLNAANTDVELAATLMDQGRHASALPLLDQALGIYTRRSTASSPRTASVLCMQGDAQRLLGNYEVAAAALKRCANLRELDGGVVNSALSDALYSLALVHQKQRKYSLADPEFKLAEKIRQRVLGSSSPALAAVFDSHAAMLRDAGRVQDARKYADLALATRQSKTSQTK